MLGSRTRRCSLADGLDGPGLMLPEVGRCDSAEVTEWEMETEQPAAGTLGHFQIISPVSGRETIRK